MRGNCTALGIFDGVHRGHRAVMEKTVSYAAENGLIPAVCTFDTGSVTTKGEEFKPIYSDRDKRILLNKCGVRTVFSFDFADIRNMSPEEFVKGKLVETVESGAVVCGKDMRIGKGASCGIDELSEICGKYSIRLVIAEDVCEDGEKISSGKIRPLIENGDIEKVNRLLGCDYFIMGKVSRGNRIGRTIGFPTANLPIEKGIVLPRFGVYASYCKIGKRIYKGITNIGVKPTVEENIAPICETYFPCFSGELYGKQLTVSLTRFIRPEIKFSSLSELKGQIEKDKKIIMDM